MPDREDQSLKKILKEFNVSDWDYVVVTDGSGCSFNMGMGYASVVICRETSRRQILYGAANLGTVSLAETLAIVQAVEWILYNEEQRKKRIPKTRIAQVHIFTDSEYLEQKADKGTVGVNKNIGLLSILSQYSRRGITLRMHYAHRETLLLNSYVDRISRLARLFLTSYNVYNNVVATDGNVQSVYACNRLKDPRFEVGVVKK